MRCGGWRRCAGQGPATAEMARPTCARAPIARVSPANRGQRRRRAEEPGNRGGWAPLAAPSGDGSLPRGGAPRHRAASRPSAPGPKSRWVQRPTGAGRSQGELSRCGRSGFHAKRPGGELASRPCPRGTGPPWWVPSCQAVHRPRHSGCQGSQSTGRCRPHPGAPQSTRCAAGQRHGHVRTPGAGWTVPRGTVPEDTPELSLSDPSRFAAPQRPTRRPWSRRRRDAGFT